MGEVERYKMFIGGEWVDSSTGEAFDVINPYTNQPWAKVPRGGAEDADRAVAAARRAFDEGSWAEMTGAQRRRLLIRLAELIEQHAEGLAEAETRCNGKLYRETLAQMKAIPEWFYYYAGWADKLVGETIPLTTTRKTFTYTLREPVGVVAAVTPWNSPLLLTAFKLAPALAAGNTFVLKPSKYTPLSALELARLAEKAGFPPGVFNVVTGRGAEVGDTLLKHPDVNKIAFTGSTDTGRDVLRAASANIAKVTLELGGKSPNIVFEDAELDKAVNGVIAGIFSATGQSCIAGSRVLLHSDVKEKFLDAFVARAKTIRLGDPMSPETEMGPIAHREQLERVKYYVELGLQEGARLIYGGRQPDDPKLAEGLFFLPTIMELRNDMRIAQEEIFGPVAGVIEFRDEEEAVRIANDTCYGLAAGLWTRDVRRAHRVAQRLRAGTVWVNMYRTLSCAVPFGGYKQSGVGRENAFDAIREFTQVKSVWVDLSGESPDPFRIGLK